MSVCWIQQPKQVVLPRHDHGVDYGAARLLLVERTMPDGSLRRLEWRPGHHYWADIMNPKAYSPATLTLTDSRPKSHLPMFGLDLLTGGRLSHQRLKSVKAQIAKCFVLAFETQLPSIDRNKTYLYKEEP